MCIVIIFEYGFFKYLWNWINNGITGIFLKFPKRPVKFALSGMSLSRTTYFGSIKTGLVSVLVYFKKVI